MTNSVNIPQDLYDEIVQKLYSDCSDGWNQYTDCYIVPINSYSYEEQMERGDSIAWDLIVRLEYINKRTDYEDIYG